MFDLDNWQEIWTTITRNKLRSFLTGFGVFWGMFMLVLLIGTGNALEGGMMENVKGFASNSCFFWSDNTSLPYKGFAKGRSWNMNTRDVKLVREKAQSVQYISPVLYGGGGSKNVVRGMKSGSYGIKGVYPDQFLLEVPRILYGRLINEIDIQNRRKICVIGKEVYETMFNPTEDPIGAYLRVNGIYYQVVGVITPTTQISIGGSSSNTVHLPLTTMQQTFNQGNAIHTLGCTAKDGYPASVVEEEVKNIIKAAHEIAPSDTKALGSFNIEKEFQMLNNLLSGVNFLILFVSGGTLLSGIIGISNIMLVTVRERTREIGVRRAIGAKPISIVTQILSESFFLTAIAGFLGFFLGVILLEVVSNAMTVEAANERVIFIPPFISFNVAIISMIVLIISGILAGLMPALRALGVKAIDAIRDE